MNLAISKDHDASHTFDEKERAPPEHNWACQAGSDYIQQQISLTTKLLSEGENVIQKQKDLSTDEYILVLGKAGSGKTSLVQFLAQNPKLQSKKVEKNDFDFTLPDTAIMYLESLLKLTSDNYKNKWINGLSFKAFAVQKLQPNVGVLKNLPKKLPLMSPGSPSFTIWVVIKDQTTSSNNRQLQVLPTVH
ncbi:hypothetical protein LSTR_LSTR001029 [Laodelphax striatellus]|uniref:Uncharacterized protein n=1 Tax=Laodelphax striatellus TaxID=195883 RepID=A0A482X1V6_LAOST|nr:hypothetical protein LSTR_LSTR001029 [Laodelphax striatellus]